MLHVGDDAQAMGILTDNNCVRISTMVHGWMLESSAFPMVHTDFSNNIHCPNSTGSIRSCQNSKGWRNVFYKKPQGCPILPTLGHHIDWCIMPIKNIFANLPIWQLHVFCNAHPRSVVWPPLSIFFKNFINIWFVDWINTYYIYAKGLSKATQVTQTVKWNEIYKWKDDMKYPGYEPELICTHG